MLNVLIFIGKLVLATVLSTLLLILIIIAMGADNGYYSYKPKCHPAKSPDEVKAKIRTK